MVLKVCCRTEWRLENRANRVHSSSWLSKKESRLTIGWVDEVSFTIRTTRKQACTLSLYFELVASNSCLNLLLA